MVQIVAPHFCPVVKYKPGVAPVDAPVHLELFSPCTSKCTQASGSHCVSPLASKCYCPSPSGRDCSSPSPSTTCGNNIISFRSRRFSNSSTSCCCLPPAPTLSDTTCPDAAHIILDTQVNESLDFDQEVAFLEVNHAPSMIDIEKMKQFQKVVKNNMVFFVSQFKKYYYCHACTQKHNLRQAQILLSTWLQEGAWGETEKTGKVFCSPGKVFCVKNSLLIWLQNS